MSISIHKYIYNHTPIHVQMHRYSHSHTVIKSKIQTKTLIRTQKIK